MFVRGNAFQFEGSPYLDHTVSIIFEYGSFYNNPAGPVLDEWHVRDQHRALGKSSILLPGAVKQLNGPNVLINDIHFEVVRKISRSAGFFFGDYPLLNLIY